jgi:hypothetical protein
MGAVEIIFMLGGSKVVIGLLLLGSLAPAGLTVPLLFGMLLLIQRAGGQSWNLNQT